MPIQMHSGPWGLFCTPQSVQKRSEWEVIISASGGKRIAASIERLEKARRGHPRGSNDEFWNNAFKFLPYFRGLYGTSQRIYHMALSH